MAKKFVIDINTDFNIARKFQIYEETEKSFIAEVKEIVKRRDDFNLEFWNDVFKYLGEKEILSEVDRDKFFLQLDSESGCLFLCEKTPDFLATMFKGIFG